MRSRRGAVHIGEVGWRTLETDLKVGGTLREHRGEPWKLEAIDFLEAMRLGEGREWSESGSVVLFCSSSLLIREP